MVQYVNTVKISRKYCTHHLILWCEEKESWDNSNKFEIKYEITNVKKGVEKMDSRIFSRMKMKIFKEQRL